MPTKCTMRVFRPVDRKLNTRRTDVRCRTASVARRVAPRLRASGHRRECFSTNLGNCPSPGIKVVGLRVAVSLARLAMTASTSLRPMCSTQCGVLPVGLSLQKHTRRVGATCEGQDCRRLVADAVGYRCAVGGELGLECAMFGRAVRALHALVNNNDTAAPGVPVSLHTLNERWPGSALPPRAGTCRTAIGAS
jgi:hypothetical protein